jgi:SAM-dependent methyltransferase
MEGASTLEAAAVPTATKPRVGHPIGIGLLEWWLAEQRRSMAERLIPSTHRSGRILDIGCGSYPMFLLRTDFREKYGVDRALGAEQVGVYEQDGVTLCHQDVESLERLPFEDGFFDVVTMLAIFEHIDPPRLHALLQEILRLLRPGGVYIMTTPAAWTDRLLRVMAAVRLVSAHGVAEHKAGYTHGRIRDVLRQAGFSERVRCGYFEMGVNLWVRAAK